MTGSEKGKRKNRGKVVKDIVWGQLGNFNMDLVLGNRVVSITSTVSSQMAQEKQRKRWAFCGKCLQGSRLETCACSLTILALFLYI